MNINDIDYLTAVAEHRHLGRAAVALGLTQPALSRAVARLETLAGQTLFERHPKGVAPTPAGEAFLRRMTRVRVEYDDALGELQQMKTGKLGLLRVGYSPSVDESVVIQASRRLLAERPAARLTMVTRMFQDLQDQLRAGKLDLLIAPLPDPSPAELDVMALYQDRMQIVADSTHLLAHRKVVRLADVAAQPWILQPEQFRVRRQLDQLVANAGLPALNTRIETDMASMNRLYLLRGTNMLTLHSDRSEGALKKLGLCSIEVRDLTLSRQIAVMRRSTGYLPPLSVRLSDLLQQEAVASTDNPVI
jgi:DNA-binding transcriptional LysR family regulator